ncbi:SDR family NAD(P)-dependent oxidoreductase [Saccharospirillum alexandrii]|uniref:SDR family NAD(P)-dependent oxidoreductase n=1 Tax=Saccharospirillum alexandrii TaxID=2448477 RepID=UPI000FD6FFC5|nr:SDR family oxidoreductase [Saccharospirillum alexandrii]
MTLPQTPSFQLTGKTALVTGASSGIGQACAAALAGTGARVYLAARSLDKLQATVAELEQRGQAAEAVRLDITDIEATAHWIDQHGPFDVLVNSAGIGRHGPAVDTTPEAFDQAMNLNVRAAYFLTQAVARGLLNAGKPGSLINISSQMGTVGGVDRSVYCATKHAVEGFTKAMAIEWGKAGVRVNTVCPTFIRTPLTESTFADPERMQWLQNNIVLDRVGEVEDIMGAVLYLASDASSLVTGSALSVDGGWRAH